MNGYFLKWDKTNFSPAIRQGDGVLPFQNKGSGQLDALNNVDYVDRSGTRVLLIKSGS